MNGTTLFIVVAAVLLLRLLGIHCAADRDEDGGTVVGAVDWTAAGPGDPENGDRFVVAISLYNHRGFSTNHRADRVH